MEEWNKNVIWKIGLEAYENMVQQLFFILPQELVRMPNRKLA